MSLAGASKNAFSKARDAGGVKPAPVVVGTADYLVVSVTDLSPHEGLTAKSMAEATALLDDLVRTDPTLRGQVQVAAAHELVSP